MSDFIQIAWQITDDLIEYKLLAVMNFLFLVILFATNATVAVSFLADLNPSCCGAFYATTFSKSIDKTDLPPSQPRAIRW